MEAWAAQGCGQGQSGHGASCGSGAAPVMLRHRLVLGAKRPLGVSMQMSCSAAHTVTFESSQATADLRGGTHRRLEGVLLGKADLACTARWASAPCCTQRAVSGQAPSVPW